MQGLKVSLLLLGCGLATGIHAAQPQIKPLPEQKRCVAMMPSEAPSTLMMVGKTPDAGAQVVMFSEIFEQNKGKKVNAEISWPGGETMKGSFTFNGPAIPLPLAEKDFFALAAQGKTLTINLAAPINKRLRFDLRDAKTLQKDLNACLKQFK